ncbi:MAG: beta-lactamase family protein [Pirellulales bacterium]|nr:beta-lactamase family protein [Pirellulales bacterium]
MTPLLRIVSCLAMIACGEIAAPLLASEPLRQALEAELAAIECPGAIVGFVQGNAAPQVFVLGMADVDSKAPMQRDFHMRVASVTKPFLGTAVLKLCDEGKLSLDDPIEQYVPSVPGGDAITLRQLGNNTSGLFNGIENKEFQAAIVAEPQRVWRDTEILAFATSQPVYNEPGAAWRYSNTNAVLLGMAIEKATGESYERAIERHVLEPLRLRQTGFATTPGPPAPAPSAYRNGYKHKWLGYGDTFYNVTPYSAAWTGAAGNMYSTVDDLLRAGEAIAKGTLVSAAAREELHHWVPTTQAGLEYGFCIGKQHEAIGHLGDVPGFAAYMGYLPARDLTLVVLANLSNAKDGSSPSERLRDLVIRHLAQEDASEGK